MCWTHIWVFLRNYNYASHWSWYAELVKIVICQKEDKTQPLCTLFNSLSGRLFFWIKRSPSLYSCRLKVIICFSKPNWRNILNAGQHFKLWINCNIAYIKIPVCKIVNSRSVNGYQRVVTGNAELGRFATHVNMKCGTQMWVCLRSWTYLQSIRGIAAPSSECVRSRWEPTANICPPRPSCCPPRPWTWSSSCCPPPS